MDKLNNDCLLKIFEILDIEDLIHCSEVCKKWSEVLENKNIKNVFFCHGKKYLPKEKKCLHKDLEPNLKNTLIPYELISSSFLCGFENEFLKHIETFIFYGNDTVMIGSLFNFYDFPKLKYLEIMDSQFCDSIIYSFRKTIEESNSTWKYFSPSIETIIFKKMELFMIKTCFTNVKHMVIKELLDSSYFNNFPVKTKTTKLESFFLKKNIKSLNQNSQDSFMNFLTKDCPNLQTVGLDLVSVNDLDKLLCDYKLKNICVRINFIPFSFCFDFDSTFSKHKARLKKDDLNLCLNNKKIKDIDDILSKFIATTLKVHLLPENPNYSLSQKYFKISSLTSLRSFQNEKKVYLLSIRNLEINFEGNIDQKIDLSEFFKTLSIKMKVLLISSPSLITQNSFDLIPEQFPNLEILSIDGSKNEKFDCEFIFCLKYLKVLTIENLKLDCNKLFKVLKNLNYLISLELKIDEDEHPEIRKLLKECFKDKELNICFNFIFNNKNYYAYNILSITKE